MGFSFFQTLPYLHLFFLISRVVQITELIFYVTSVVVICQLSFYTLLDKKFLEIKKG